MDNLSIFNQVKNVPPEAQKVITGGRLAGFTEINPMWRIEKLTEIFGPAGFGWYYEITEKRIERCEGEKTVFVDGNLYKQGNDGVSIQETANMLL